VSMLRIGQSELLISRMGLGCMGMSEFYGPTDDAESLRTLARARDLGVNFFDTADMYGHGDNEQLLGKFAKTCRDEIVIATKFGIVRDQPGSYSRSIENDPSYIKRACEASLRRLGVDEIDLYYAHRVNPDQPIEETVGAMAELVKEGKVKAIGLCEVSADMLSKANSVFPISAVQTEYSLWTRGPERELLPMCEELNVSLVAYCPLGRGFLTGRLSGTDDFSTNDFRHSVPRFNGDNLPRNLRTTENVAAVSRRTGMTQAQVSLNWLLSKHRNVIPIPGTRNIEHLEENVATLNSTMKMDDVKELDRAMPIGIAQGERYSDEGMKNVFV